MYTYIILIIISLLLSIILFLLYNKEVNKEVKYQNKNKKNGFLISGIIFLLITITVLIYIVYNWKVYNRQRLLKYYSKKLLEDSSGDLNTEEKEYAILEDCTNLFKNYPDKESADQYFDMKDDFANKTANYKMDLLDASNKGECDIVKKSITKINDLKYNEINFCKTQALQKLHYTSWNEYMQTLGRGNTDKGEVLIL